MKIFIAVLVATLAVAAQASYEHSSYWPSHSAGWSSWNNGWNGWNGWNGHQVAAYPVAKTWASSWPATGLYNNGWSGYYGGYDKINSWAQPWGTYGAGWGYQNVAKTVVPSVKVNSWGLPWGSYGAGAYGWDHPEVVKTIVPVAKQVAYVAPVEKVLVQSKW
ncbi:uncharacterized protein LOC129732348 [Wyeomyia smithii]|uniref:uncharacterized protein LOC129732348 n=1 Tax=Wyeomyia smithii TaxID=174621 RepID=UPI00246821D8|nr:uncharacterized protein LOC129732348 [Wyeomyia smithii]